jgi:spore coat protein CotH
MNAKHKEKITAALERISSPVRWIWPRLGDAVIGIFSILLIALCCLTYSTKISLYASKLFNENKYVALINGFVNPFRNQHLLMNSGLPIYDLKIKRREYAVIEQVVADNIKQGRMTEETQRWANAKFIHDGKKYDVKVRVRGDLSPHWADPKKSWRIKFVREKLEYNGSILEEPIYFEGKRQINLIIPSDKRFALAKFINDLLREEGLVALRDRFAILRINGIVQGLYYETEHFDKPLFAAQGRPETTVFGQTDRGMHFEQYTKYGTPGAADAKYDIGTLRLAVDPAGELALRAIQVLNEHCLKPTPANFRRARAVLDWDKYLRMRAMATLCNTNHLRFGSDNLKLYFDPSRGLLEPIPWDVLLVKMPKEPGTIDYWNSHGLDELQRSTLLDPELRLQRNKILWSWVGDGGDSLMARYNKIHERIRPLAWADVLTTPIQGLKMDEVKKELDFNVRRTHKVLRTSTTNFTYKLEANNRAALELSVMNFSGIQLKAIELADTLNFAGRYLLFEDKDEDGELQEYDPIIANAEAVNGKISFSFDRFISPELEYRSDFIETRYWEFFDTKVNRRRFFLVGRLTPEKRDPLEWTPPQINVVAFNAVTGHEIPCGLTSSGLLAPDNSIGISTIDMSDPWDLEAPQLTLTEFLRKHPQFAASREVPGAAELSGKVTIAGAVFVPYSVPLILRPGADITMKPSANVICYGGLASIGAPENRIRIHGDGSGDPFDTFAVVRPKQKVIVKYTDIQHGGQSQINGMFFTGGFAVHDGDLEMDNCRITDMQSEDGVNLKNGNLLVTNCLFANTAGDAFDIDFGKGEVRDSKFMNTVGDAVDFSGSYVTVSGCRFEDIGDKGSSVGEDSHPILVNNLYLRCNIAVSCKDLSSPKIAYCTFVDNKLAIEAKRKKEFFGGGSGEFVNCVFSGNAELFTEDYFSQNQILISHSILDVAAKWPTCKTAEIRFVDPAQANYVLDASSLAGNGLEIVQPEWLPHSANGAAHKVPGIFGSATDRAHAQATQRENKFAAGR